MARSKSEEIARGSKPHRRGQSRGKADWGQVPAQAVLNAIRAVTATGGALRFGYTRDGGAFAIGIYDGPDTHTEYVSWDDDCAGHLGGIEEDFTKAPAPSGAGPGRNGASAGAGEGR